MRFHFQFWGWHRGVLCFFNRDPNAENFLLFFNSACRAGGS
jgi:hypothetical protein